MSAPSLRRRLLLGLLGAVGVAWLLLALASYVDAHHEIDELFDAQLTQSAQILLSQATDEIDEIDFDSGKLEHEYQRRFIFQIRDNQGRLLAHSAKAPRQPLSDVDGFRDMQLAGETWRVFALWDEEGGYQVQVAERHDIRGDLAQKIALRMLLPAIVLLPLLALLVWVGVGRGLAPLQGIAREVAGRAPQRLEPLDAGQAPEEILPLVSALNNLFSRLDQAMEHERRFTADAAHELRTPLAALRVQAQVALRAQGDAERRHAIEQAMAGVDRATRLVEQLLTLARLDPEAARAGHQPVELRAAAAQVLADLAPEAVAKQIDLSLAEGEPTMVLGNAAMLAMAIRNLVDNAVRYTPAGGRVTIAVHRETRRVALEVSDNGPGIPPGERGQVLERFYRGLGTNQSGSGLGLSIVRRVVELHDAELYLGEGEGGKGLRVRVLLHGT